MNEPLGIAVLARAVWQDFWRARRALIVFEVLFKLLEAWLFVPAVAFVLAVALARAGHVAVSNRDVLDFLLSPPGLLYAALVGTVTATVLLLEQAGIMVLAARTDPRERPGIQPTRFAFLLQPLRIAQLGAWVVALLTVAFLPFGLLAWLTYRIFLSQHDINFYLAERPPALWWAVGAGVLLVLGAGAVAAVLFVRWALAVPILLFEGPFGRAALRASAQRVGGVAWRVGFLLLGWLLAALLLGAALMAGFRLFAAAVLAHAGERPTARVLLLLLAQGGLFAAVSFVTAVGQGLLTRRLYLIRSEQLGLLLSQTKAGPEPLSSPWPRRLFYLGLGLLFVAPLALWADLSRYLAPRPPVQITAHRGHARAAPENTLSAVRKAIDSRADFAEVDVQTTADGVVVLLHDRDLKRVAGDPRRLTQVPYDEVRQLDVGSWFGPSFAAERVPTLAEVIELSRGRIQLNLELKLFGPDRGLARAVARLVRATDFESDCVVTSFDYDAVLEIKRLNPRLRTGLIVAHALGDVSRLDVDVLSVRADWLSDDLLRSARRAGKEVHVWTVNDAGQMTRLMKRGVDNILTSDPDLAIRVRDEWAGLTEPERLLLAARLLLGLNP